MAKTNTIDITSALRVVISPFCPTIMPDKIGIIGNTQGVNDNNKPKPKKLSKTQKILSCCSSAAILSVSFSEAGASTPTVGAGLED